jgi:hypothetical protein
MDYRESSAVSTRMAGRVNAKTSNPQAAEDRPPFVCRDLRKVDAIAPSANRIALVRADAWVMTRLPNC